MSGTNFTSGPWYPGHLGEVGRCQCETFAGGIAHVHMDNGIADIAEGGNDCPPKDQAIANMHLIASAPDLYEALQGMIEWFGNTKKGEWHSSDAHREACAVVDKARAALSRAKGDTT